MKRVRCWRDMEEFGVMPLTGESCVLSLRLLCDLTPAGADLLEEYLGGNVEFRAGSNWNPGYGGNVHVASVTLPHDAWKDLAVIALFREGYHFIVRMEHNEIYGAGVTGCSQEEWEDWKRKLDEYGVSNFRVYTPVSGQPYQGTRSVHYMSGRST